MRVQRPRYTTLLTGSSLAGRIGLAAIIGFTLGQLPTIQNFINNTAVGNTNMFVTISLVVKIYPPLRECVGTSCPRQSQTGKCCSIVQNRIVGPFVMFLCRGLRSLYRHGRGLEWPRGR